MNMEFSIAPYVGPLPLRFGMRPDEVETLLGSCLSIIPSQFVERLEQRDNLSLGYSGGVLAEAVFSRGVVLRYEGNNLLDGADPIKFLRQFDDRPFEFVGFIVFAKLGIRLSGFHDNDDSQKAIGIVRRGYWDEYMSSFVPYLLQPE